MAQIAFLDTMIYLHFKPVEDIPWTEVLEADAVRILVPRITLRELDTHKDSHPLRKIKERARRVLQRLDEWDATSPTKIRPGVEVQLHYRLPGIDYDMYDLDPKRNDDILLATILDYKSQHPDEEVVLVTQDTTPRLVGRALGINSVALSEALALPPEIDAVVQENRDLRKQLERMHSAMPKLSLLFQDKDRVTNHLHIRLETLADPEAYVRELIKQLRQKYPIRPHMPIALGALTPSEEEYARYKTELEGFFSRYEDYLYKDWKFEQSERLTAQIQLQVANDGSAPADDVDIHLLSPGQFELNEDQETPSKRPTPPNPPEPPRSRIEIMQDRMEALIKVTPPRLPDLSYLARDHMWREPPNVSKPTIQKSTGYEVHWKVRRIKHKQSESLHRLAVSFPDYGSATSFSIDYRIQAANLPDQIEGTLHVVVEKED